MQRFHTHPLRHLAAIAIAVAASSAGCAPRNVAAEHTGRFAGDRPVIALGTCCVGYDPTDEVEPVFAVDRDQPDRWLPACAKDGTPWPAGHRHDIYFTGNAPRPAGSERPAEYRYQPPEPGEHGRFAIDLQRIWPHLRAVDFHAFKAHDDGELTREGAAQVGRWLHKHYGPGARIKKLGEGGFSIAYRVCRGRRDCVVVKIRKLQPTYARWQRIKLATAAAAELKRDLAVAEVAGAVTSWTRFVGRDGEPAPLLLDGKPLPPSSKVAASPGRLARAARFTNAALLAEGALEQKLIAFRPSPASLEMLDAARPAKSAWRSDAISEAAFAGVPPGRVLAFFDSYSRVGRFGPEVIKAHAFFMTCERMAAVTTIRRYCTALRRDFAIPDDFDKRVSALEWMYRDSAADVIRWSRNNFGRALGNPAADGVFREIGLDYNHGRNAGWDPETRQFVLFDF